ncbi:MAG: CarD family transcriptional regulator, partial [Anaerovoracaceae bacterium]
MKIMIPVDKSDEIGVRTVISEGELVAVIEVLKSTSTEMSNNWNRRHRENMEKLKTGKATEVAEVVRNLLRMEREKHLSTGEKKMLANAKKILQIELILAGDMEQSDAEKLISDTV